ncbi:MAG: sigZ [Thermomicrobiales bacterium]|jgi:RNA polymerase sigma-70 factor (ECF subfamily)|nr:sigZ [Thermomicrobiales bacterium]
MVSATQGSDTQQIWSDFGDRLRTFIARRVDSDADADDILQEVFLRIHRHAGAVQNGERLVSWLFQVTRNAIADYYRTSGRRELPSGAPYDLERQGGHAWQRLEDPDVASPAVRRELAACLGPMVAQLPPLYRDAVRLVDLEGIPQREAAARSGITVSGMKSRVQRGRRALKSILQSCCQVALDAGGRVSDYQPRDGACSPNPDGCGCQRDESTDRASAAHAWERSGGPAAQPAILAANPG